MKIGLALAGRDKSSDLKLSFKNCQVDLEEVGAIHSQCMRPNPSKQPA
jgi:hypothetical protein